MFGKFIADENGVTTIEYGLIALLMALTALGMLSLVGTRLFDKLSLVAVRFDCSVFHPRHAGRSSSESRSLTTMFNTFASDENGATAIEYGMIAALIAVAVIATLKMLGTQIDAKFVAVSTQLN